MPENFVRGERRTAKDLKRQIAEILFEEIDVASGQVSQDEAIARATDRICDVVAQTVVLDPE